VQHQGDISITVRPLLSARARAKKYRSIQLYISGNPRKEVAYSALGIWIQEFHSRYFGRNAEGRQYSRNWWAAIETDPAQAPIGPAV